MHRMHIQVKQNKRNKVKRKENSPLPTDRFFWHVVDKKHFWNKGGLTINIMIRDRLRVRYRSD